jgi:hypothetical protein
MTSRAMDITSRSLQFYFGQRVSVKTKDHNLTGIFDGFTSDMLAIVKIEGENPFETKPGYVNAFRLDCVSPLEPKRVTNDVLLDPIRFFFGQRVSVKTKDHTLTGIFDGFTPDMWAIIKIQGENPFETKPGYVNAFHLDCVSPLEPNLAS